MALIDVIVPVYNGEKYIEKCINSLANQTCKDFRIICVNDGSTDGTLDILQNLKSRISNIMVLDSERGGYPLHEIKE